MMYQAMVTMKLVTNTRLGVHGWP